MGCCSSKEEKSQEQEKKSSEMSVGPQSQIYKNSNNNQNYQKKDQQSQSIIYHKGQCLQLQAEIDAIIQNIRKTLNQAKEISEKIFPLLNDHPQCLKNKSLIERLIVDGGFIWSCQQNFQQLQDSKDFEFYYQLVQAIFIELASKSGQDFQDFKEKSENFAYFCNQFKENIFEISELQNLRKQYELLQKEIENNLKNLQALESFLKQIIEVINQQSSKKILISQDYQRQRYQFSQKFINQLYDRSWRLRAVDEQFKKFVRAEEGESELKKNYSLSMGEMKTLKTICKRYRPVRGDGNCFYTAFIYQFLCILLRDYSNIEFDEFFNKILNINLRMEIHLETEIIELNDQEEQYLLQEFIYRLIKLREIEDVKERIKTFTEQFASYDETNGCLYGLSIIFLRNLSNYTLQFHPLKDAVYDSPNLLIWEQECNSNEVIIDSLGQFLNINIQLAYLEDKRCEIKEYVQTGEHQIILLIKPGHYNIGVNDFEMPQIVQDLFKVVQKLIENLNNYSNEVKQ